MCKGYWSFNVLIFIEFIAELIIPFVCDGANGIMIQTITYIRTYYTH